MCCCCCYFIIEQKDNEQNVSGYYPTLNKDNIGNEMTSIQLFFFKTTELCATQTRRGYKPGGHEILSRFEYKRQTLCTF